MAETQDEEHWLYGDDIKEEPTNSETVVTETIIDPVQEQVQDELPKETDINGKIVEEIETEEVTAEEKEREDDTDKVETEEKTAEEADNDEGEDKEKNDEDDEENSSSDDEPIITIGKISKQPDIIKPPPPTHRAAATTGLKDEDFEAVGKVNGIPVTDLNVTELEEKPWRKPGADLSDYFNYGFSEETWIKYCERQRTMRVQESGVGLGGLGGIPKLSGSSNIPVSIINENSKYGGFHSVKIPVKADSADKTQGEPINTIQVMTAEKRSYSHKVTAGNFENDFSGPPPYGDFYRPPPPFFSGPPPSLDPSWVPVPSVPPPGWTPDGAASGVPPPISNYYDDGKSSSHGYRQRERDVERERSRERSRDREDRDRHRSRERESRHRRRSRSSSRPRHKKRSRSHSRSRSPSHRHKRKKNKRDRDDDSGRD